MDALCKNSSCPLIDQCGKYVANHIKDEKLDKKALVNEDSLIITNDNGSVKWIELRNYQPFLKELIKETAPHKDTFVHDCNHFVKRKK